MSTGKNIRSEDADQKEASIKPVMNILRKDVQIQLRKKKYPFKCKRHFEKKTGSNGAKEDTSPKVEDDTGDVSGRSDAVDTPQPTKRKLIDFRNKVYVAPLTTVGNLPFRRIMKKFGADISKSKLPSHRCENKLISF
jgi:tRNA-dihydrouridine synthase 3